MRQIALSDFDSRKQLSDYLEDVLPCFEKQKIKTILCYDPDKDCFLDFPGMISFEDTMLSLQGYAVIFEDLNCLFLKFIEESKIRIGVYMLEEADLKQIASLLRKDFLNVSEFVYSQGRHKLWTEYSFRYARIAGVSLAQGTLPDSPGSITLVLTNRKKLIFRPEIIDDKLYTELIPVRLRVIVSKHRTKDSEHDRVRQYLRKRHRD